MSSTDTSGSAQQHSHPHNNTMSRNEKFWVDQVTPPPPPREQQGVGNDKGGRYVVHILKTTALLKRVLVPFTTTSPPFVIATQKLQINTVPTPSLDKAVACT